MTDPLQALTPEAIDLLRRHHLLRTLVERQVVDEAVGGVTLTPEEQEQSRRQFLHSQGIGGEEALQAYRLANGLTPSDLERRIALPLRIRRWSLERFGHRAEARFLQRKNQLDRVVYSLLRVKDGLLARELYLRLAADEASFAELAARYAEGPEKATRGIVGPVPLTQAHPLLAERLRTSQPGVLQEPFPVSDWWLVVRLESYTPASFDTAMAVKMSSELFTEWLQEQTTLRVSALAGSAPPPIAE